MSKQIQVDAIYTDFSKAFDRVDHRLLVLKLKHLGLSDNFTSFLSSYLTGRGQIVKLDGNFFREIKVTSGVPQGSHLGPILFLLFIDDLCFALDDVQFLLYADDLKLYKAIENPQDHISLQENADLVEKWCTLNGVSLNVRKCNVISFSRKPTIVEHAYSINGTVLDRVGVIKDLGVWLDCKLSFKRHVDITIAKANSVWSLVKRFSKEFKNLYTTKPIHVTGAYNYRVW